MHPIQSPLRTRLLRKCNLQWNCPKHFQSLSVKLSQSSKRTQPSTKEKTKITIFNRIIQSNAKICQWDFLKVVALKPRKMYECWEAATRVILKKNLVLKNFALFTRKRLCCSLRPATLFKRDSSTGIFLWILQNF